MEVIYSISDTSNPVVGKKAVELYNNIDSYW